MRKTVLCVLFIICVAVLCARPATFDQMSAVASQQMQRIGISDSEMSFSHMISFSGIDLAGVWLKQTGGYVVVSADDEIPPVIAYSAIDSYWGEGGDLLDELLRHDLGLRWQQRHLASEEYRLRNAARWQKMLSGTPPRDFQQWPPAGYSPTQGWLKTNWTQTAPYNAMCPMDPVTNTRSIAGCPAVAIAQIVNYHQCINGTELNDGDDYYHNYAGRSYYIDNDAAALDFPSFPTLNGHLTQMMYNYKYQQPLGNNDKAALVFASGVTARQVFTSQASGTFAVSQAMAAIQRFNFDNPMLVTQSSPELYQHLAQNIMEALPALLAVVTPAWDAGHNVVVDGYNTDGYFHLNFGWGGSYNGWYLLPDEIPYNLTVLEGLVLDIRPQQYLFSIPEVVEINSPTQLGVTLPIEMINLTASTLEIEAVRVSSDVYYPSPLYEVIIEDANWPLSVGAGQSFVLHIRVQPYAAAPREHQLYNIRVIHGDGVYVLPLDVDMDIFTAVEDELAPAPLPRLSSQPNPFKDRVTILSPAGKSGASRLEIFNLRGQKVRVLDTNGLCEWDGRDETGKDMPTGVYHLLWKSGANRASGRVLKIK